MLTKYLINLVRTAGLEPAQGFPQGILSPLRLPFRHVRGGTRYSTTVEPTPKDIRTQTFAASPAAALGRAGNGMNYCGVFFGAGVAGAGRTLAQGSFAD